MGQKGWSQSHVVPVRLIGTAEAEGAGLACWRLRGGNRRDALLKEEAECILFPIIWGSVCLVRDLMSDSMPRFPAPLLEV